MTTNGFFKIDDPRLEEVAGFRLLPGWWSRPWEYAFGLRFAQPGQMVADMGCGHNFRPFKDALAQIVDYVYAVDADAEVLQQTPAPNMELIQADFTRGIPLMNGGCLDRVFCISVLEDLERGGMIQFALEQFAWHLRPTGKIVVTFDVQYDEAKESGPYPGVNLARFVETVDMLNLAFEEDFDLSKENAVVHTGFNLCVFHAVIVKP